MNDSQKPTLTDLFQALTLEDEIIDVEKPVRTAVPCSIWAETTPDGGQNLFIEHPSGEVLIGIHRDTIDESDTSDTSSTNGTEIASSYDDNESFYSDDDELEVNETLLWQIVIASILVILVISMVRTDISTTRVAIRPLQQVLRIWTPPPVGIQHH